MTASDTPDGVVVRLNVEVRFGIVHSHKPGSARTAGVTGRRPVVPVEHIDKRITLLPVSSAKSEKSPPSLREIVFHKTQTNLQTFP
jgi:hypothetical protein